MCSLKMRIPLKSNDCSIRVSSNGSELSMQASGSNDYKNEHSDLIAQNSYLSSRGGFTVGFFDKGFH